MTASTARERDPHYRKIVEGLAGPLDRDLFEECVQDLLRQDFPGLVGVYGGSDGGMDGAIPDGEGEPYALVVTTAEDVIRNLTRSLDRRIKEGDPRRKVVLATSQELTPKKEKNLKKRAREKEFLLIQIFERHDIASRLYRDSKWTKLLLDITGEPSALSPVPQTRRPLLDVELVGRADDLAWLRETPGDRLLVGEPGSGKTSLLLQLVEDGTALFLSDIEDFAPAFRDQHPEIVLVDDAHVEPKRLVRLRQIRREIFAENSFSIVATSWKGGRDEVMDALGGVPKEQVRSLELLTRSEIVEVYRKLGLNLPDDSPFLAELVTQAAHRPGLAVTLGWAWLSEDYEEVLTGQAIYRSVVPFLRLVLDRAPEQLMAALALGGDRGMGLTAVADFLGGSPGEVRDLVARVGASGILAERGKDEKGEVVLTVNPPALRAPLLEKIFFGELPTPWQSLARRAPSLESVIESLLVASNRNVPVPRQDLQMLLTEAGTAAAWGTFALLGADEAEWALRNYPESITHIAPQVLASAPRPAIRALLREAEETSAVPDSDTTKPLKVLREWSEEVPDHSEVVVERRRLLVDAALQYLRDGGDSQVALITAFFALSPRVASSRVSAAGDSIIERQGSLLGASAPDMLALWERVEDTLPRMDLQAWRELDKTLRWWIHPNASLEEEPFHRVARRMLTDLAPVAEGRPGLTTALLWRAEQVDLDLDLAIDPVFDTLYRDIYRDPRGYEQAKQEADEDARCLAREWARRPANEVIDDLVQYSEEANWVSAVHGDTYEFELALSQAAPSPEEWLTTLLDRKVEAALVLNFLGRVVRERCPGWQHMLERSLQTEGCRQAAVRQVLQLPEPPGELLRCALEVAEPQTVGSACHNGKVPMSTLRRLLDGPDPRLALAAAVGEWLCNPREEVRSGIRDPWRKAILESEGMASVMPTQRHWLDEIFSRDPALAYDVERARREKGHES